MYRNIGAQLSVFEQAEDNHKDIVISTLKKELNDLRDLETDFLRLTDEINRLESRYTLLLEEKNRNERQHKLKMDINKKAIGDMRTDVDALKKQIHKTTSLIQKTIGDNSIIKKKCQNRNAQISSLMSQNRQLEKHNDEQEQQNRNITFNIKQLKQERIKLEAECERLHDTLDANIIALKNAEKEARALESTNTKLSNTLLQAEKDNHKILSDLKQTEQKTLGTQKHLDDITSRTQQSKNRNKQLELQCLRLQGQCQSSNTALNIEVIRNKKLSANLKQVQNTIRARQVDLQSALSNKQGLHKQYMELVDDNKAMNNQIQNCLLSVLEYQKYNCQLQRQIQNYIATDEIARGRLSRKDGMRLLLEQVVNRLEKTSDQIAHLKP